MKTYQFIKVEIESHVATVFINNPKKANALNQTLWFELGEVFEELDKNSEVRVCLLTGSGRHFTAGIDLSFLSSLMDECKSQAEAQREQYLYRMIRKMQDAISAIESCRKPVIAAIHGVCIGGGVDVIAACDMRFATKLSVLSIMETRLGIVADMGTLQRLNFILSDGRLKELALTSKLFRGYQAEQWGLVNRSFFTQGQMMKAVKKLAREIAQLPVYAVQGTKKSLNFSRENSVHAGLEAVAKLNSQLFLTAEASETFEGVKTAFKGK